MRRDTAPIRAQILTCISLMDRCDREKLVKVVMSHPGCEDADLVHCVLDWLIEEGAIGIEHAITVADDVVFYIEKEAATSEEDERAYARACRIHRWRRRWWAVRAVLQFWKWRK